MTFTRVADPERDALALYLRRVGKWPVEKIARHLGVTPDTVSHALRRAARMSEAQRQAALVAQPELAL